MKNMIRRFLVLILSYCLAFPVGAEQIFFYHTDSLGTPLAMTNSNGEKVWEADYMPFGEEYSVWSSSTDIENNKRFIGKEKDAETGFNYFGARYLSTNIGRFLAPDSVRAVDPQTGNFSGTILGNPQRQSLYAYALNNPYKYLDPDGEFVVIALALIGAIVYGNLMTPGVANTATNCDDIYAGPSPLEVTTKTFTGAAIGATVAADGVVAGASKIVQEATGIGGSKKGLGKNPFKGKTPKQIDKILKKKGFEPRGPDPLKGKGGYVNSKTGRSFHIDKANRYDEPPHVDVNRPRDYKGTLDKRKYGM